jgi:hypothetical protein
MDNLWKSSKVIIDGAGAASFAFAHKLSYGHLMIHGIFE